MRSSSKLWAEVPGSSRSGLLDIKGPSPGFGAAINALLCTTFLLGTFLALGSTRDRNNRWSILAQLMLTWVEKLELEKSVEGVPTCLHGLLFTRLRLQPLELLDCPWSDEYSSSTKQDGANNS
jgi:hypothetical protein